MAIEYSFDLPSEEQVIKRNRTITAHYAQLYQKQPQLYKWAGMAAFASFHIGEKLQLWNWQRSGISTLPVEVQRKNRSLEDDFQVIRIINNKIFLEIGWVHLAFCQMDFPAFYLLLLEKKKHELILHAFEKLNDARTQLKREGYSTTIKELIWEANTEILWHEQSEVVQPLFDKLTSSFSGAMTFFASFDYNINHRPTNWKNHSSFILFMLFSGASLWTKKWLLPEVTNLQHRWHWIHNDLLKKWEIVEADDQLIAAEITLLAQLENTNWSR